VNDQQPEVIAQQQPAPVKKEAPVMSETRVLDGATPAATSGKKKNSAKKQKTEPTNGDALVPHAQLHFSFKDEESHTNQSLHLSPYDQPVFSHNQ